MRWLIAAGVGGVLLVGGGSRAASGNEAGSPNRETAGTPLEAPAPLIDEIVFVGLRHIAPDAVQAQISSHAGSKFDAKRIEFDVKALGRLGWFGEIRVETLSANGVLPPADDATQRVRLIYHVEELPDLVRVEYSGSNLLSKEQIEKILAEKLLTPRLGEPAAPANLARIASTIRSALAELGHPQPQVQIHRDESANGTVRVRYEIDDGPHIPVGRIDFEGHPEVSPKLLRHVMKRTAPTAFFASWRGKDAYTREGFEEDRARILIYYQDHGYPEARIGTVRTSVYEKTACRWVPWPHHAMERRLAVSVAVEAGPFYSVESIAVSPELAAAGGRHSVKLLAYSKAQSGSAYSAKAIEDLRHAWVAAIQPKRAREEALAERSVETKRSLDMESHLVRETIGFSDAPPYLVRRIDFIGLHRFSDRYVRRRIGLREGHPFDERALEAGLARLATTGYFHQIKKEDVRVRTDEITHNADVTIRISEAGQQRTLFSGGHGEFGSTLGIAYALFDLLQREELLTAQIDGGPESLQIVLGLVMEGFLGSRSSLAISVFDNVLRPRFASSVKGPFYTSQSEGLNAGWSYPLTQTDTLSVNYSLSHTNTDYSYALPSSLTGLPSSDLRAETSSSGVGLGWTHDTGSERLAIANSISGGFLGGTENLIRSNEEYARIFPDPFFNHQNAWAFRTTLSGAGSYQGDMPLYARLFSGDAQVRGFSSGELGPYAIVPSVSSSGSQTYSALPAGANIVSAANAEYRVPLGGGTQAVGFFDLGSGWLLPNWLGNARPTLLDSTNGILHGSVGIELRWTVPEIQVPVRAYYSVNILRLNQFLQLPDGSLFHARNKLFAFGWALGTLF
ncbi:MAG TPA: POTRA domain-containing protein [Candidatus Acidoferrum sp.]|nr:POTRA domain-containing protein [Candidatus Acidoferrum sp.]